MVVHIDRVIRHLKAQIQVAEKLQSDWVYITLPQAEECLKLALKEQERQDKEHDNTRVR